MVASYSPAQCFHAAIEAARIALKYRTPVILLSDGYLANGSEPWSIPDVTGLPDISVPFQTEPNHTNPDGSEEYWPYLRDPETLARPWAIPGTPGLMHRVGGLEKADGTGNIDYTPDNHEKMTELREAKVAAVAQDIPPIEVEGDEDTLARPWAIPGTPGLMHRVGGLEKADKTGNVNYTPENHQLMGDLRQAKIDRIADDYPELEIVGDEDADICVLGWGSTWAAIHAAVERQRRAGHKLAWIHLEHLNPLPNDLGDKLRRFDQVLVPELNKGQLCQLVRGKYLVDAQSISKVAGLPFRTRELEDAIEAARSAS